MRTGHIQRRECTNTESGSVFLNPDDILFRNPRGEIKGSVLIFHGEAYEEGERITSRGARGKVLLAMVTEICGSLKTLSQFMNDFPLGLGSFSQSCNTVQIE